MKTAELPALTQADLCALGAAHRSLICARTWGWWTGLGNEERADLTARSLGLLAMRGLIRPVTRGPVPAAPVPELGLILAARARPDLIVTCQVPGQDAAFEPRFFGLTSQDGGLRALVREILTPDAPGPGGRADLGTILRYTFMPPPDAASAMTAWAGSRGTATVVDVLGHNMDGKLALDRFEIRPAGPLFGVRRLAGGIPPGRGVDDMELCQILTAALNKAAR